MGEMLTALSYSDIERMASDAAASGLYGGASKAECVIRIVRGIELGLPPGAALSAWHNMKGNLVLKSDLHVAVCLKQPVCAKFVLVESTPERCTYAAQRLGGPEQTFTFTLDDAKKAGLLSNNTWQKYPSNMLRARCGAITARAVFPDVVGGLYDEGEGEEIAGERGRAKASRYKADPSAPAPKQLGPAPTAEPPVVEGELVQPEPPPGYMAPDAALSAIEACESSRALDDLLVKLRKAQGASGWSRADVEAIRAARDARSAELVSQGK
jgi:hypothetical protein